MKNKYSYQEILDLGLVGYKVGAIQDSPHSTQDEFNKKEYCRSAICPSGKGGSVKINFKSSSFSQLESIQKKSFVVGAATLIRKECKSSGDCTFHVDLKLDSLKGNEEVAPRRLTIHQPIENMMVYIDSRVAEGSNIYMNLQGGGFIQLRPTA